MTFLAVLTSQVRKLRTVSEKAVMVGKAVKGVTPARQDQRLVLLRCVPGLGTGLGIPTWSTWGIYREGYTTHGTPGEIHHPGYRRSYTHPGVQERLYPPGVQQEVHIAQGTAGGAHSPGYTRRRDL